MSDPAQTTAPAAAAPAAPAPAMTGAAQAGAPAGGAPAPATGATGAQGGEDALDKGIDTVMGKLGHKQNRDTTEKISDGIRNIFKKVTGKDVPIKDQNPN